MTGPTQSLPEGFYRNQGMIAIINPHSKVWDKLDWSDSRINPALKNESTRVFLTVIAIFFIAIPYLIMRAIKYEFEGAKLSFDDLGRKFETILPTAPTTPPNPPKPPTPIKSEPSTPRTDDSSDDDSSSNDGQSNPEEPKPLPPPPSSTNSSSSFQVNTPDSTRPPTPDNTDQISDDGKSDGSTSEDNQNPPTPPPIDAKPPAPPQINDKPPKPPTPPPINPDTNTSNGDATTAPTPNADTIIVPFVPKDVTYMQFKLRPISNSSPTPLFNFKHGLRNICFMNSFIQIATGTEIGDLINEHFNEQCKNNGLDESDIVDKPRLSLVLQLLEIINTLRDPSKTTDDVSAQINAFYNQYREECGFPSGSQQDPTEILKFLFSNLDTTNPRIGVFLNKTCVDNKGEKIQGKEDESEPALEVSITQNYHSVTDCIQASFNHSVSCRYESLRNRIYPFSSFDVFEFAYNNDSNKDRIKQFFDPNTRPYQGAFDRAEDKLNNDKTYENLREDLLKHFGKSFDELEKEYADHLKSRGQYAEQKYTVDIPETSKMLILSSGGRPKNFDQTEEIIRVGDHIYTLVGKITHEPPVSLAQSLLALIASNPAYQNHPGVIAQLTELKAQEQDKNATAIDGTGAGHYTANVIKGNKWYYTSDSTVRPMDNAPSGADTKTLFYKLVSSA